MLVIGLRLLLPLLVVIGLRLSPLPLTLEQSLYAASVAHQRTWHDIESAALQKIAAYQPWRTGIWEQIGIEALAADDLETALNAFREAEERVELSINGRVAFGEVYWRQADFDTAMKTWQPLFERGQAEVWLFERAAEFRRAAGDRQALAEILQMWAAAYPTMAEPAYELAILLLPDDPESSKTFLRAASRQDAALRGHIFTLEQALERAATEEITAYGQVLVGRTLASLGEWEAAERTFELATQMNSEYAEAWAFLAEARQQNGSDGQAAIEKALAADPQSIAARTLAALFWRRAGDRETGLAYLQDLAADFPQQGVWQVEIAHTLAEMGKYDQALDHLHLATTVEPVNAEFWYILGRFCVDNRLHVREIGLPAARHALSLALANPDMHDLMGLVLLRLEDEIGAERFLRRALQINPAHASAHLHLGQLYLNHHKYLKAAVHLRQARDSAGENQAGVGIIAARLLEQYGLAGQ